MIETLFSMAGKICVVTGGSSGLGSYMAQGFLEAGAARVYITARSVDNLNEKAEELSALGDGKCVAVPGDLATLEGVEELSAVIREKEDYVDVLVNNAGIGTGAYIDDLRAEDWDRTMDLNLRSPLFLTQAVLDLLRKRASVENPSSIIFISSVAASEVFPHVMAYSTSKKSLEHLTPQLALALADDQIRVNTIAPGRFYSEMTRSAWQDSESEAFRAELERLPAHRYGGPEDIAGVAIMLCSRAGSYFTGEVLNLDGGHRIRR